MILIHAIAPDEVGHLPSLTRFHLEETQENGNLIPHCRNARRPSVRGVIGGVRKRFVIVQVDKTRSRRPRAASRGKGQHWCSAFRHLPKATGLKLLLTGNCLVLIDIL